MIMNYIFSSHPRTLVASVLGNCLAHRRRPLLYSVRWMDGHEVIGSVAICRLCAIKHASRLITLRVAGWSNPHTCSSVAQIRQNDASTGRVEFNSIESKACNLIIRQCYTGMYLYSMARETENTTILRPHQRSSCKLSFEIYDCNEQQRFKRVPKRTNC